MGATLKDTLLEARKAGKSDAVKAALKKRIQVKKNIRDGKAVDPVAKHNAQNTTPNDEAKAALKKSKGKSDRSRQREIAADRQADIRSPKKKKVKKDVFSVGGAIRNIRKSKSKDI